MRDKKRLIWKETGPAIEYDGSLLYIEDLNPHVKTKWRMSRLEMIKFGLKTIFWGLVK